MSDFGARLDEAGRSTSEPTLRLGQAAKPVAHGSSLKSLLSNLKDFLTERPEKVRGGAPTSFDMPDFGAGFGSNIKEFFRSGPRGRVRSDLLVNWDEEPSLWRNLCDLIWPPKLPPLQTTSKAIPVPEIWTKNKQFSKVQLVSILVHVIAIALIVLAPLLLPEWLSPYTTKASAPDVTDVDTTISPFMLKPAAKKAGGGGGQHDLTPATKGQAPKFSDVQFSRPMVHPPAHPEIAIAPTILGNPQIVPPNNNMNNWGDPLSKTTGGDSMGQGRGNGIGNGNGNGMGPGEQYGIGGGLPSAGTGGYGYPVCLYCPHAEYSDEAMKVKVQGVVELIAVVTADGRVTDVHVAKGLGFGLDEKALEAVRSWRLTPARGPDGRPAAVRAPIEVVFQLF
ncbi:MAG TPA: energy transducer TonB [Candidatus Baltobacteraceae bacterium]|jgi:periplasmic protein TonB|nr:energy transducer TonB [Candidatus Baltobacteraceae bacterium]